MLSEKLRDTLQVFIEKAEKQERYTEALEDNIQAIVAKCEQVYRFEHLGVVGKSILEEIIEEYKEDI